MLNSNSERANFWTKRMELWMTFVPFSSLANSIAIVCVRACRLRLLTGCYAIIIHAELAHCCYNDVLLR